MSRNNTGNPIGSKAFPDFEDNVKNLDEAVNTADPQWVDRFGRFRLPLMEQERQFFASQDSREDQFQSSQDYREDQFQLSQDSRENQFQSAQSSRESVFADFLQASGYQDLGEYAPGIEITAHNQYVTFGGQPYLLKPSIPVPYTTSGEWTGDDFKLIGDALLSQDLANPDKGAAMVARGVVAVDSIADLLALPEGQRKAGLRYLVRGFYRGKASGGGGLYWDPLAPADRHNGVTHYSPEKALEWDGTLENIDALYSPASADGLFIREGHDTLRIPCSWGGVVYGDRDNARALNLLAEAVRIEYSAQADGRFRGRGCVVLSGVDTGRVSTLDTWVIPREIDVEMRDPIYYGGPNDRPAVIHGEEGVAMRMNRSRYAITRDTSNGRWSDSPAPEYQETGIGLVLINQLGGGASFTVYGFEIGVKVLGAGSGASYAKYDVEYLFNNKVALWLHANDGGWVNENSFFGGNHGSAGSFRNGHACQAVRSTKDGPTGGNNNNTWYSPSFESMGYDPSGDQKPIIDADRMTCCRFLNIRDENPGSELLYREGPLSNSNEITWGYSGLMDTTTRVQMSSITKNLVYGRDGVTGVQEKMSTVIWDSGSLSDKARTVNGRVVIPDVQLILLGNATDPKTPGWSQPGTSVSVGSSGLVLNARTVGAFIKLNGAKRFIVAMAGENCSLFTTVYDENFNQITDLASKNYLGGRVFSQSIGVETYLGGSYRHSNQINNENFISVLDDSVKYVGLHCQHGPGGYIDGFKVLVDLHDRAASGVLTQSRVAAGAYHFDSIPISGDFQLGDTFYTTAPVPGGYAGWKCVEPGSPGVWKGFGKIEE